MVDYLSRSGKPALAYVKTAGTNSSLPTVVFCSGYRSDMEGTKALFLDDFCKARGQAYLRFDYSGHGRSEGIFDTLLLSDWLADTKDMLAAQTSGPVILVGSSMGGWLSLRIVQDSSDQVAGFVGVAAAPDFTRRIEDDMTPAQRTEMAEKGYIEEPNEYSDQPYIFRRDFMEDGRAHLLLDRKLGYAGPVRLLQGKRDTSVDWRTPDLIKAALPHADVAITLIEAGDHSLSRPEDLDLLGKAIESISG